MVDQFPARNKVNKFLAEVAATPVIKNRLIFSMDATASRSPTWDRASHYQAQMFEETANLGGLAIQLCYYRGFKEFHTSAWHQHSQGLLQDMLKVSCLGGHTQIRKVLSHALNENLKNRIRALVFIGDAVEEDPDELCHLAGKLGLMKVPVFAFQEGQDAYATGIFTQIASLSGGAYSKFDLESAAHLKSLLTAVAVYAAGGKKALDHLKGNKSIAHITKQITG